MIIKYQGIPSFLIPPNDGFFRTWWFEPFLSTLSFAIFINIYWYHERKRKLSKYKYSDVEHKKQRFRPIIYHFGSWWILSLSGYWIGITVWKMFIPPPSPFIPDGIPRNAIEAFYLVCEITSGVIAYDFLFFFIHWAMHDISFLRKIHHRHHNQHDHTLEVRDTLHNSLFDGSLQVIVNIMVQRHTIWGCVKTRLARAVHNVVVIWMLCESHTASPTPKVWRRWPFVGVMEHRMHHLGIKGGHGRMHRYQQFFGYLDDFRADYLIDGYHRKKKEKQTELKKDIIS